MAPLEIGNQRQMVNFFLSAGCLGLGEAFRMKQDIPVREQQPFPFCQFDSFMERVAFADPAFRQFRDLEARHLQKFSLHPLNNFARPIGGPVIDDDNLNPFIALGRQRTDAAFQRFLLVAGRDYNRDQGPDDFRLRFRLRFGQTADFTAF
ncbi:hypothetical protein D3C71_1785880 [compost metagenome]